MYNSGSTEKGVFDDDSHSSRGVARVNIEAIVPKFKEVSNFIDKRRITQLNF